MKKRNDILLKNKSTYLLTYLLTCGLAPTVQAEDFSRLETISVEATNVSAKKSSVNSDHIRRGLVWDERDLLRNQPGITVTEGGRSGVNGFSMRGVDSDRVHVSVDNVSAVESYMPRFYYIKGFYNGNRNNNELENLAGVEFNKGADSLATGSGALGGSVVMRTKNPQDFVLPGNSIGLYSKTAYASKNREFRQVLGVGVIHKGFEGLVQVTRRKSEETKNYYSGKVDDIGYCGTVPDPSKAGFGLSLSDEKKGYPDLCGRGRILPDDVEYRSTSWLAKLGYRFNNQHFITGFYETLKQDRYIEEKSHYVAGRKQSFDITPYKRYGILYEYTPDSDWLNLARLQITRQKVQQQAESRQFGTSVKRKITENYSWPDTWHTVEEIRSYNFLQTRTQFDFSLNTKELDLFSTSHAFDFGLGFHQGKLSNYNKEWKAYNTTNPWKEFVIQQPVKSKLFYAYLRDNIIVNDKFSIIAGLRFDQYRYKPELSGLKYELSRKKDVMEAMPKTKFSALTYSLGLNYSITPETMLSYSFSTGFRAPKVEEMYFELKGQGPNFISNPNLKPETAQNHELTLSTEQKSYALSASLFYTQYRNFLDLGYKPVIDSYLGWDWSTYPASRKLVYNLDRVDYQHINVDKAYIVGIDIDAKMYGDLIGLPREFYSIFKASYAKGRKNNGTSLLAVQPLTLTLGLGYQAPDDKWNVLLTSTYVAKKREKDAMGTFPPNTLQVNLNKDTGAYNIPMLDTPMPHPFLNNSYFVFDLTAQYRINEHFTINAGIFNLFNRKYSTWDNLRQVKYNGTQGDVYDNGRGIERYTAPGRNFAVSVEARF